MEEPKATVAGPDAPKRKGRPPGKKREATDRELIQKLAARIDELESEKSNFATPLELKKIELAPEVVENIPPGTLIKIGENADKSPIYRKKPWRRSDFDKEEKVTFYAPWDAPVTINGVSMQIVAGENVNVPVSFRDVYRRQMGIQHADYASLLPAPSPDQVYRINEAARKAPGTRVFSGLHHIGVGLDVHIATPDEAENVTA